MGATFPKTECLPNCLERVILTCEDRFLKKPNGLKLAKVEQGCREECNTINQITSITHVSDAFVSSLADSYCGGPRGSGKKSEHFSLEIRGTNGGENTSSADGLGTKAQDLDRRLAIAEDMAATVEQMRDSRTWYQSFSDQLYGPGEPSRRKLDEFKSLISTAKDRRTNQDFDGARNLLDQAIPAGRNALGEYDRYMIASLDHADRVKWVHLSVSILLTVGCGATATALALGGASATAGTAAGGAEVISLFARTGAAPVVQETLKRAAMFFLGLGAADEITSRKKNP